MTDNRQPQDKRQLEGYEKMLQRVTDALEQAGEDARPRLRQALEQARRKAVEFGELSAEEAERISDYLQRDVEDAASFLTRDDKSDDLRDWFRMDMQLIGSWLYDRFSTIADSTRLEWIELNRQWQAETRYHTGEITSPGELRCLSCGKTMHFEKAGHIPPCPGCKATEFERVTA
ncbi:zinc ribbon-containing protein [Aquisalimonas asiatica]|uniref:Zinc-ribbon containing domain-containing protein n=1 Tax=Aquisalimonas asiatica TaxID=406100 RepID=A0A1H8SAS0_9GAMM|nr:zinc ribbon-containing protein [Aquisalimonas asiatica]SEO75616.1 Zinc-ribbon containing domain-containing protein [Aquisalimonas asiatica]